MHIRARRRFLLMASAMLVLLLILNGCYSGEFTEEIWLQGNERWKADVTLTLNADEHAQLEDELDESDLNKLIEDAASEGVSLEVSQHEEPEGGISYLIKMSGQELDTLNENCFNGDARISKDDNDHIHISWDADSMRYSYDLSFREMNLILHGGKIISSNADTTTDNAATWYNPSQVQVELTEGGFPFAKILAVGMTISFLMGSLVLGGVGLFLLWRKQQSKTAIS